MKTLFARYDAVINVSQSLLDEMLAQAYDVIALKTQDVSFPLCYRLIDCLKEEVTKLPAHAEFARLQTYLLACIEEHAAMLRAVNAGEAARLLASEESLFPHDRLLHDERTRLRALYGNSALERER